MESSVGALWSKRGMCGTPYDSGRHDVRQGRGHVDVLPDDEVARVLDDLDALAGDVGPGLLADDPDASAGAGAGLGGLLGDDELEARHGAQAALEGLARLDEVIHGGVGHGLRHDEGVVGRALEEGRLGEVEEDRVGVEAAHGGHDVGGVPLDLVEDRLVGGGHDGRAWSRAIDRGEEEEEGGAKAAQVARWVRV